jgi:hypothetical protein
MLLAALSAAAVLGGGGCHKGPDRFTGENPNAVNTMRVPTTAEVVIQGRGQLDCTFRESGTMWLYDATAERTLFTIPVDRGQRFTVIPRDDRAALDGQDVFGGNMELRNEHRIYLLPGGKK